MSTNKDHGGDANDMVESRARLFEGQVEAPAIETYEAKNTEARSVVRDAVDAIVMAIMAGLKLNGRSS